MGSSSIWAFFALMILFAGVAVGKVAEQKQISAYCNTQGMFEANGDFYNCKQRVYVNETN